MTLKETLNQLSDRYLQQEISNFDNAIAKLIFVATENKMPPQITIILKQIPNIHDGWIISALHPYYDYAITGSHKTALNQAALLEILKDAGGKVEKSNEYGATVTFSLLPK